MIRLFRYWLKDKNLFYREVSHLGDSHLYAAGYKGPESGQWISDDQLHKIKVKQAEVVIENFCCKCCRKCGSTVENVLRVWSEIPL